MLQLTRNRFILCGFALLLALVGVTGFVASETLSHLLAAQDLQDRSLEIRHSLLRVIALLTDSETAQRGFIITGDEAFLEPHLRAKTDLAGELQTLRELSPKDPATVERIQTLESLISKKLSFVERNIAARRKGGFGDAERQVSEGMGRSAMDAIRRHITRMDTEEKEAVRLHSAESERAGERARLIVVLGSVLAVVSAGFSLDQVRRGFQDRARAHAEVERSHALLEERVRERTAMLSDALKKLEIENNERKQLEGEILQISEREQHRIAQDLHDGLGQLLAGAVHLMTALQQSLSIKAAPEEAEADNLKHLIREALDQTRSISRGLYPVREAPAGLMLALKDLAARTTHLFQVDCQFRCESPVYLHDYLAATHLYRIAQEAITNAIKHGKASRISISLSSEPQSLLLRVTDNGTGMTRDAKGQSGLGQRIMMHRAAIVRGALTFETPADGGTSVSCSLPGPNGTAFL
jgi:signal transduction histidine kinase